MDDYSEADYEEYYGDQMGMNFNQNNVDRFDKDLYKFLVMKGPIYSLDIETTTEKEICLPPPAIPTDSMKKLFNFKNREFVKMTDRYPTWKTKYDGEMYIKNMSDSHLINTITMIESNYNKIYGSEPNLENVSLFCPEYRHLKEELGKRQKESAWKQDIVQRLARVETLYNSASEANDRNGSRYISLYETVSKMSLKLTSLMAINESLRKEIIDNAKTKRVVKKIIKKVRKNVKPKSRRNV